MSSKPDPRPLPQASGLISLRISGEDIARSGRPPRSPISQVHPAEPPGRVMLTGPGEMPDSAAIMERSAIGEGISCHSSR